MSDKITFTLDGEQVTADKGLTIWEVANGRGLKIPHLCHKPAPGYRPDGNCRACMVEIEGERTLAASCIREPAEGMVVTTNNARAENARKMVMELLVADQPAKEEAHDKSSHLWDMAELNGVEESRFPKMEEGRIPLLDDSHVAMSVNLDACISCGLCVRACREVQVNDVIGMAGRGHDAYPTFDISDPMGASSCVACGECVQACPTGALMPARDVALTVPDKQVDSVCPYCGVGCGCLINCEGDRIVGIGAEYEGDFRFSLGLQAFRGRKILAILYPHVREEDSVIRLIHSKLGLNGLGGQTDLPAYDGPAGLCPEISVYALDRISCLDVRGIQYMSQGGDRARGIGGS